MERDTWDRQGAHLTWTAWLVSNVSRNAEAWRERDKGEWQRNIHAALKGIKKTPWTEKAIWNPRDYYGMKSM